MKTLIAALLGFSLSFSVAVLAEPNKHANDKAKDNWEEKHKDYKDKKHDMKKDYEKHKHDGYKDRDDYKDWDDYKDSKEYRDRKKDAEEWRKDRKD
ncbi:hypothetical protein [Pseudomaricurvus sp.]|uniref:hypothetical protein n=1 Tax=Pseudomaricurvus sp. TaxID=2004510 RepID=UPI003F6BD9F3